jgi:hypothetical protein
MWKVVALLGLMGSPAVAQTDQDVEFCTGYGNLAADIMTHRQNGTPISTVLGVINEDETEAKAMVMEAFGGTRFHSPSGKQRAVDDFRNDIELRCLQSRI